MIVHLACASTAVVKKYATLQHITNIIHRTGHVLARDWIEPQYHIETAHLARTLKPDAIYELTADAIERADLVIIEESEKSFGLGFQTALALAKKKPVLLLLDKANAISVSKFAQGINDPLLNRHIYVSEAELEQCVRSFIEENTYKTKDLRFNFVLDPRLYNHLRWKSFKMKKTKAEVVRELLIEDMDKS